MEFVSGIYQTVLQNYQQMLVCPDLVSLEAFVMEKLSPDEASVIEAHLSECPQCLQLTQTFFSAHETDYLTAKSVSPEVFSSPLLPSIPKEHRKPAPGQIWSIPDKLPLPPPLNKLSQSEFETGFLRLFVILSLGPCHLGRFQELILCPISEQIEMATHQDIILMPHDTPFEEKLILEVWNSQTALSDCLLEDLGDISTQTLKAAQAAYQGLAHDGLRGGTPAHPEAVHLQFQALERSQLQSLKDYMLVLQTFVQQSSHFMIHVTPKGLKSPSASVKRPTIFPDRLNMKEDSVLAASAGADISSVPAPVKERLIFENRIFLDLWLEAENLEFVCLDQTQQAIQLQIIYFSRSNELKSIHTDTWGTAFIPVKELALGANLFEFVLPGQDAYFYPFDLQLP